MESIEKVAQTAALLVDDLQTLQRAVVGVCGETIRVLGPAARAGIPAAAAVEAIMARDCLPTRVRKLEAGDFA